MKIKDLPLSDRPYEKLKIFGAQNLSDAELLSIIIKTGFKNETVIMLAQRILKYVENNEGCLIKNLQNFSIEELKKIKGIGEVKAIQLKAVCEISKRMFSSSKYEKVIINSSNDVAMLLMSELRYEKREKVKLILLNIKNVIQKIVDISYGGTNSACVLPKDILAEAIKTESPRIILVHNHPSGDSTPSKEDYNFTFKMKEGAELLGIELLDHIVIGDGSYNSIFSNKNIG